MPPTTPEYVYCTEDDLRAFYGEQGLSSRVDDDRSNGLSAAEQVYLDKARYWATDKLNFYLLARYPASRLATSWVVNNWCVIFGARWLSQRLGNPPPGVVNQLYDEAVEDLKAVHAGVFEIPGIGTREVLWPAWSNVRVDVLYTLRRIRVERPISEKTTPPYRQHVDHLSDRIWEP